MAWPDSEGDAFLQGSGLILCNEPLPHRLQSKYPHVRRQYARVEPRYVEQRVEHDFRSIHGGLNAFHNVSLILAQRSSAQRGNEQAQRMHRLTQIMAGGRKER